MLRFSGLVIPQLRQQPGHLGIVPNEFFANKRKEIVAAEIRFAALSEILHRRRQGIGAAGFGLAFTIPTLDGVVFPGCFRALERGGNPQILKAARKRAMVVGMRQFVEGKIWHPPHFTLKSADVSKLDPAGHCGIAAVGL